MLQQPPSTSFLLSPPTCNRDSYQTAGGTCLERKWRECTKKCRQNREQNACTICLHSPPKCPTFIYIYLCLHQCRCTPIHLSISNPVYWL